MPAGSLPSWAQTSSSAALFGGGASSKASGRAAADAQLASSSSAKAAPSTPSQPQQQLDTSSASNSSASALPSADTQKPYQPKRKQKSIMHCPPLTSVASSSRVPYSIPYVDEPSANEALFQLIAVQAKRAGFEATTASALHEVSQLTKKFLTSVFSAATHAAELSCRDQPSARDLVYALETHGQPIRELRDFHREQLRDAEAENESTQAIAKARGKARELASKPEIYKARRRASKVRQDGENEEEEERNWVEGSNSFLPSDSDDGSEMDAWSVSSDSDDEHGNRRAAVQARVAKCKHDISRTLAKKEHRQAKLRQPTSMDQNAASSSSSARDMRALTSGEQAWRRIADHVVPRHLPGMPPRHAWLQTPAFPTNAYGSSLGGGDEEGAGKERKDPLMLVNRKLANARLVEASLRKLIQNTDGAAAVAYASSTKNSTAEKESVAPPAGASATSSGFVVPKTPASSGGSGLTLRLKSKISLPSSSLNSPTQPSTPIRSRRGSTAAFGGASSASGVPGTPLGMGMSMGWGGEPLMSPLTPVSNAAGGMMTPYPPTPGGVYGHYFGSNPNSTAPGGGSGGYRSRSQSIVAAGADPYGGALSGDGGNAGANKLGVRVPGPVNYKNVWYAPGSTIASGGLAGAGPNTKSGSGGSGNHPRSVKRMRKWKV